MTIQYTNPPDSDHYTIIPPDMDYEYFQYKSELPFESDNIQFSSVNCWWMAESAFLVYTHPGFARMAFKLAGFDGFKFFQGTGTECMVSWNKTTAIVAFRGTELNSSSTFHELRTDLNAIPTEFELGGRVHKGFLKALEEIWGGEEGLEFFINELFASHKGISIWITGHSLGGALAGLCFTRIKRATGLYVFGAPKIGDDDFVELTKNRPIWRIENDKDPIPFVPLNLPNLRFYFAEMGQLIFLDDQNELQLSRPELTSDEHKELVLDTLSEQKDRSLSISKKINIEEVSIKKNKELYNEVNEHFKKSLNEWKQYFKLLKDDTTINIEDHMPIYYALKSLNLIAMDILDISGKNGSEENI